MRGAVNIERKSDEMLQYGLSAAVRAHIETLIACAPIHATLSRRGPSATSSTTRPESFAWAHEQLDNLCVSAVYSTVQYRTVTLCVERHACCTIVESQHLTSEFILTEAPLRWGGGRTDVYSNAEIFFGMMVNRPCDIFFAAQFDYPRPLQTSLRNEQPSTSLTSPLFPFVPCASAPSAE
eukprot:IDg19422t1